MTFNTISQRSSVVVDLHVCVVNFQNLFVSRHVAISTCMYLVCTFLFPSSKNKLENMSAF